MGSPTARLYDGRRYAANERRSFRMTRSNHRRVKNGIDNGAVRPFAPARLISSRPATPPERRETRVARVSGIRVDTIGN